MKRAGSVGFSRDHAILALILLVGCVLRVCYLAELRGSPHLAHPLVDASFHDYWARGLVTGDWARACGDDPLLRSTPYLRPPGYPLFLALVYALTGCSYLGARVVQMLLGLVNAGLAYLLGRRLLGRRGGLLCAAFMATYWIFIYFEGELLAPVLLVALGLAAVLLLDIWRSCFRRRYLVVGGIALGLFALVRPNILLFVPLVFGWVLWVVRRASLNRSGFRSAAVFALAVLLPIVPVTIRNYAVSKEFVLISANAGINLYVGNSEFADGFVAGYVPGLGRFETCFDYAALVSNLGRKLGKDSVGYAEASSYFTRQALAYMVAHPGRTATLMLRKLAFFWGPLEIPHNKEIMVERIHSPTLRRIPWTFPFVLALALAGAAVGPCRIRKNRAWQAGPGVALVLLFVGAYSVSFLPFFVASRYRVPVIPFLLLFAAGTVLGVYDLFRARAIARGASCVGIVLIVFLLLRIDFFHYDMATAHAQWYFFRGSAFQKAGRIEEAIGEYAAGVGIKPSYALIRGRLGKALLMADRPAEALPHLREASRLEPYRSDILYELSDALSKLGRQEEAAECLERAMGNEPGGAQAHNALGIALAEQGRLEGAIREFSLALERGGDEVAVRMNLGSACARLHRYEAAARHFSAAMVLAPGDARIGQFYSDAVDARRAGAGE